HALEARHDCGDAGRLHLTSGQGAYACVLPREGPALGPIEGDRADRAYPVQPAAVGAARPDVAVTPKLIAADPQRSLAPTPATAGRAPGDAVPVERVGPGPQPDEGRFVPFDALQELGRRDAPDQLADPSAYLLDAVIANAVRAVELQVPSLSEAPHKTALTAIRAPEARLLPAGIIRRDEPVRDGFVAQVGGEDAPERELAALQPGFHGTLGEAQPPGHFRLGGFFDVLLYE